MEATPFWQKSGLGLQTSRSPRALASLCGFEQEPGTAFGFVDPDLDQAGARDVTALITKRVCLQHLLDDSPVILQQLRQHVAWRNLLGIVILDVLEAADVPDRLDGLAAELTHALRDDVRRTEDLCRLIVEQQVVIAKMWARHVPMKIFRLEIEGEHVGQ